jgi:hypothetical protein
MFLEQKGTCIAIAVSHGGNLETNYPCNFGRNCVRIIHTAACGTGAGRRDNIETGHTSRTHAVARQRALAGMVEVQR